MFTLSNIFLTYTFNTVNIQSTIPPPANYSEEFLRFLICQYAKGPELSSFPPTTPN